MPRDTRADILGAWTEILIRYGADRSVVGALVLELEQAAAGRGVRLSRPQPPDDPAATDWRQPPTPGDAAAGLAALRRAAGLDPKPETDP